MVRNLILIHKKHYPVPFFLLHAALQQGKHELCSPSQTSPPSPKRCLPTTITAFSKAPIHALIATQLYTPISHHTWTQIQAPSSHLDPDHKGRSSRGRRSPKLVCPDRWSVSQPRPSCHGGRAGHGPGA